MEILIPQNDSVRLLSEIMDQLDFSVLYKAYSCKGRKSAVSPRNLFKIIVYGYMNNLYTSRSLEKACRRDINFMWLLEGKKAPDHNTIARFRSQRVMAAAEGLFYQLVQLLKDRREISFENLFVDGTKIEANANKYSFVWRKTTEKNAVKLQDKLTQTLSLIRERHELPAAKTAQPQETLAQLREQQEQQNITLVQEQASVKANCNEIWNYWKNCGSASANTMSMKLFFKAGTVFLKPTQTRRLCI